VSRGRLGEKMNRAAMGIRPSNNLEKKLKTLKMCLSLTKLQQHHHNATVTTRLDPPIPVTQCKKEKITQETDLKLVKILS
jgi:hypothetical protein